MDAAALRCSRPAADSNCLGGPGVLPTPATAGAPLAADASEPQWPGLASPEATAQSRQAAEARFVHRPGDPRSDRPPTEQNIPMENGAHQRASDRWSPRPQAAFGSGEMDRLGSASAPPRTALAAQAAPEDRGQSHQQNDVDAETIRTLSREFPLSKAGNQGPPVPPARPRPPCGPGCGSDRWWRCAPSRKSRHGPPAG